MTEIFRPFSSGLRKSGSDNNAPIFDNYVPFNAKKGDVIKFKYTMANFNNITATNNSLQFDPANGTTYKTATIIAHQRIVDTDYLTNIIATAMNTEASPTDTYTMTYSIYTDRIILSSVGTNNFSINVVAGDLLNYLGFSVGVHKDASSYISDEYFDLIVDDIYYFASI